MHNNSEINKLFNSIDSEYNNLKHLLEEWSEINSHSFNINGLAKQCKEIIKLLEPLGCTIEEIPLGKTVHFESSAKATEKLLGNALVVTKDLKKRPLFYSLDTWIRSTQMMVILKPSILIQIESRAPELLT